MVDPFCQHAYSAKVPSEGSFRTVSANISDYSSLVPSVDATSADNYICARSGSGLKMMKSMACTMNAGVVTYVPVIDSSWAARLTHLHKYRVVCSAVRITYTGAPLSAQGYVRITKTSSGDPDIAGDTPKSLSDLNGHHWDFSASELIKGVTIVQHPSSPEYKQFQANTASSSETYEDVQLMAVGLASTASFSYEVRQTIEYLPLAGTSASLIATPNVPQSSVIDSLLSWISSKAHISSGSITSATKAIGNVVNQGVNQVLQSAGSSIWSSLEGLASDALGFIPEALAGAAMLL